MNAYQTGYYARLDNIACELKLLDSAWDDGWQDADADIAWVNEGRTNRLRSLRWQRVLDSIASESE